VRCGNLSALPGVFKVLLRKSACPLYIPPAGIVAIAAPPSFQLN